MLSLFAYYKSKDVEVQMVHTLLIVYIFYMTVS